ncbi:unnamed protein product [marine sediment metagenome]|uniref:Uncharacterized protein n=1 Tax=marine sediment metagenome TaxID=412755 RepID=X1GVL2_9ZZZZ
MAISKVDFLKPGIAFYSTVYEKSGNVAKNKNEPFTAEEIEELKSRNVQKLYYVKMNDDEVGYLVRNAFHSP